MTKLGAGEELQVNRNVLFENISCLIVLLGGIRIRNLVNKNKGAHFLKAFLRGSKGKYKKE